MCLIIAMLTDLARRVSSLEGIIDVVKGDVLHLLKDKVVAAAAEVLNCAQHQQPQAYQQRNACTSGTGRGQLIAASVGTDIIDFQTYYRNKINKITLKLLKMMLWSLSIACVITEGWRMTRTLCSKRQLLF